jgi:hypothetical protein
VSRDCKAALNIQGAAYGCDLDAPHSGLAHANDEAGAIWCSDGEARRYGKEKQA